MQAESLVLDDYESPLYGGGMTEALIASEVKFWRELIESIAEDEASRHSLERMRQALALAEFRLAELKRSAKILDDFAGARIDLQNAH